MSTQRFFGANVREVFDEIKRVMGEDAIVISNRAVNGGVEVIARMDGVAATVAAPAVAVPEKRAASMGSMDLSAHDIMNEIRMMRGALEGQMADISWSTQQQRDPVKAGLVRTLLHSGFSPALAREFFWRLPNGCTAESGMTAIKDLLANDLQTADVDQMVDEGGVFALIGPTGVGKTTTTAKLAARCVIRHGAESLALLTTDGYRVGAQEQLRIYGKILGVPVYGVKDAAGLEIALSELGNKHMVLIDTVGMSQRDRRAADQIAMLSGAGNVKRMLLLNATYGGKSLDDMVRVYGKGGLYGCMLTKLDEAVGLGSALDVVLRHELKLHYVTNGQRVPEDLHAADARLLVESAVSDTDWDSPYSLDEDEVSLAMTPVWSRRNDPVAGGYLA